MGGKFENAWWPHSSLLSVETAVYRTVRFRQPKRFAQPEKSKKPRISRCHETVDTRNLQQDRAIGIKWVRQAAVTGRGCGSADGRGPNKPMRLKYPQDMRASTRLENFRNVKKGAYKNIPTPHAITAEKPSNQRIVNTQNMERQQSQGQRMNFSGSTITTEPNRSASIPSNAVLLETLFRIMDSMQQIEEMPVSRKTSKSWRPRLEAIAECDETGDD